MAVKTDTSPSETHPLNNADHQREQGGNPRPAPWPPPSKEKIDRIVKNVPAPKPK